MKKRDKMKMMGILILLLAVITVAITLILVSRLSKTAGKDQKEETFDRFRDAQQCIYLKE